MTVWLLRLFAALLVASLAVSVASGVQGVWAAFAAVVFGLLLWALMRGGRNWWIFLVVYTFIALVGAALHGEIVASLVPLVLLCILLSRPIRRYVDKPSEPVRWTELIGR
ncbi:hypothetical protein [Baekduia sp.]|jgi:hypothetical protein|uniref:hypothetical protein n=1 Tax=Baekduia sp. TaxID=2600305 RepID=UPI002E06724A|nr:hypothetical protein [Baekduia sp.]